MDPIKKVRPGERLQIPARAWNRVLDTLGPNLGYAAGASSPTSAPYTAVYARNSTAETIDRWGILDITGVEITPTSTAGGATAQFESMPVLTGGTPSAATTAWCVAVEPITAGKIGRVAVAGVVQCKACDLGKAAGAFVLWKNEDWALIRMEGGAKLGVISSTWGKGLTMVVSELDGEGAARSPAATFQAKNYFATVTVLSGTKRVACAKVDGTWILISAEC